MPKISVLLPVYNAEKYVGKTIQSVLDQTYPDFELIAVDDGSSDESLKILKSFDDKRLKTYHHENHGLAATLNTAFRYSSGEFLARIDADDICLPERFQKQITYLNNNQSIAVVGSAVQYIDNDGNYVARSFPSTNIRYIHKRLARGLCCLAHPTVMMRSKVFRDVGGYNELIGSGIEDSLLWAKIINNGHLISNISTPLVKYRLTSGAISCVELDDEYNTIVKEIFLNINQISDELAQAFIKKHQALRKKGKGKTTNRVSSVENTPLFRVYKRLINLQIPEVLCEKIVCAIRVYFDRYMLMSIK